MPERTDYVLSYAQKPNRFRNLFAISRRQIVIASVMTFLLLLVGAYVHGPTREDIRLDTGDLRYLWWGVPLEHRRMPEPKRTKLLALAAKSATRPAIPATWVLCVEHPPDNLHGYDSMCRRWYGYAAAWADEDQQIARWALEDVARHIERKGAGVGMQQELYWRMFDDQTGKVIANWRDDEGIKQFCTDHGYTPPPPK